ncbi:MAG: extracellular solute-binding protein [candidate division NC10 bacterium]|nr:extracellular solute-binding protein [candidate division NC10 bacterium]
MRRLGLPFMVLALGLGLLTWGLTGSAFAGEKIVLNVVTAGDTNMHDLQKTIFGPEFIKKFPNVEINAVGSGPGDPGSQVIFQKLKSQKDANVAKYDIDVAIIHQSIMPQMIQNDLLAKYGPEISTYKLMSAANGKNALGFNVEGYVMPMFQSQVVLAYNPDMVKNPPNTFEELVAWIKANPKKFGYNGVKGGMSGTGFTTGWVYWKSGKYDTYAKGSYDTGAESTWPAAIKELKALPVTMTTGNNDTLDKLNRGELAMGPVWADMLISMKNENRMDPKIKMKLIAPGLPGQPMYLVITKKSPSYEMAKKFVEFITSPEQQAKVIVGQMGWLPGIDAKHVLPVASAKAKEMLFADVPPDTLEKNGLMFPQVQYFKDLLTAYEEN